MDQEIAVIGSTGFVGRATCDMLKKHGINPVEYHVDKGVDSATKEEVNRCVIAIVCVPTPMGPDGDCNLSILEEVISWLETPTIVIKSTVPIGTTTRLRELSGKKIIHNPEFLREAHAARDAQSPRFALIGGESNELEGLYKRLFTCPIIITSPEYSEAVKYAINSFLAYKVGFFNELWKICEALGLDGDVVTTHMLNDHRIGESHTFVTTEGGFGGHCFPKDLNALIRTAQHAGYEPDLLKQLWQSNRQFRDEFKGEEFDFYGKN